MGAKQLKFDTDARNRLLRGVDLLAAECGPQEANHVSCPPVRVVERDARWMERT